jgi:selenocysteine lyase/cysteine desulfurase
MDRRNFLQNSGLVMGASLILPALSCETKPNQQLDSLAESFESWDDIRKQFNLMPNRIHMTQMLLASHPAVVRKAIEMHRNEFDKNPTEYWEHNFIAMEERVLKSAAMYLNVSAQEIALTDSTTMGLGILYTGLKLRPQDEILTTTHDHYATEKALEYAAIKNGASIKSITLYDDATTASIDQLVGTLMNAITPATKIIAVTWVHSCTGMKLPIREMAEAIKEVNKKRDEKERIYFCVDGVHGFGVENITMNDLGCDFFAAGTHKWMFGPRGTGILYGKKDAWQMVAPSIPSFGEISYSHWLGLLPSVSNTFSDWISPGGFHSFEHRWALNEAFDFHMKVGKEKIQKRTHEFSTMVKRELAKMQRVKVITPTNPQLSSGINCFEVEGMKPEEVVKKLAAKNIIASASPYQVSYARFTPCIINTEDEVMKCLEALYEIVS